MKRLVGVQEMAAIMGGLPRSQIYRMTKRGELPHLKAGKYLLYDPDEVLLALRKDTSNQGDKPIETE